MDPFLHKLVHCSLSYALCSGMCVSDQVADSEFKYKSLYHSTVSLWLNVFMLIVFKWDYRLFSAHIEVVADKFIALDMLPSYATYTHSSFELIRPFVSSEGETILSRIFYI